jgi:hypothetical protein
MKESKLQNYVKKYYENGGRMVYKTMGGFVKGANYTAAPGWPDLMVFGAGEKMFFIECKNETGKLRDTQIVRIFELQRMGYLVIIARPFEKNVVSKFKLEDVKITRSEYIKALERIQEHKELKKLERARKKEEKLNEKNN